LIDSFSIPIGDHSARVYLTAFKGELDMYQIFIDNYYHGYLKKRNGIWVGLLSPHSWLQAEDISLLGEWLDGTTPFDST